MGSDDSVTRDDGLAEAAPPTSFDAGPSVLRLAPRAPNPDLSRAFPGTIRVLVVDGCDEDATLVAELLARSEVDRFRVERALDGAGGLARLLQGRHDVGLVDQQIGGGNGLALIRSVRQRGGTTPLILLSAGAEPGLDLAALEAGAADFLDKEELAVERLERAIRLALARQRREAAHAADALRDPITGLPGRQAFLDRLEQAIGRARRHRGCFAAVLLELDGAGGTAGSGGPWDRQAQLRAIGERLRRVLRGTDTAARLEGGRFGLLLEDLARPELAGAVVAKVLAAVGAPARETDQARAGLASFPDDGGDAATLLARAEAELVAARRAGAALRAPAPGHTLERSIREGRLALLFQPQVTLCATQVGLAALARWPDAPGGPMDFAAMRQLAETAALTEPLGDWLVAAACTQAMGWNEAGLGPLHVAVPVLSRRQLAWSDLARRLADHLARAGLRPTQLELELDEAQLLPADGGTARTLAALRELGVRLAVAGFGSGPTSLALLRDLPLTTVKLARSLLDEVPRQQGRTAVACGIVRLAAELGLRVVADGVGTRTQLQLLRDAGCHAVQSPLCCAPLPAAGCADWLRQARRRG